MIFDSSGHGVCPLCVTELQITTADTPEPASYGLIAAGFGVLIALSAFLGRGALRNGLRIVMVRELVGMKPVGGRGRIER